MGEVHNIEDNSRGLWGRAPFSVAYDVVGLVAAIVDCGCIVIFSVVVDFIYRKVFYGGNDYANFALAGGFFSAVIFILIGKIFALYGLSSLSTPVKYISKILVAWILSALLVTAMLFLLHTGAALSRGSTTIFALLTPAPLIFFRLLGARTLQSLIARGVVVGRRAVVIGEESELARLSASSLLTDFGLTELVRF